MNVMNTKIKSDLLCAFHERELDSPASLPVTPNSLRQLIGRVSAASHYPRLRHYNELRNELRVEYEVKWIDDFLNTPDIFMSSDDIMKFLTQCEHNSNLNIDMDGFQNLL